MTVPSGSPSWVVGDTFLVRLSHQFNLEFTIHHRHPHKNVYSVFRSTPPSVGSARLFEVALAMNGVQDAQTTVTGNTNGAPVLQPSWILFLVTVATILTTVGMVGMM